MHLMFSSFRFVAAHSTGTPMAICRIPSVDAKRVYDISRPGIHWMIAAWHEARSNLSRVTWSERKKAVQARQIDHYAATHAHMYH